MMRTRRVDLLLIAASLLMSGSCVPPDVTNPSGDHRETTLLVRASVAGTSVATLVVDVTAPDILTALVFNIPIANGVASGTITLPAGSNRTITMRAFDAGGVETHSGSVTVNIQFGTNPVISLVLVPLTGQAPINATLGSFVVTVAPVADTLAIGGTASLTAAIVDGNGLPVIDRVMWATLDPHIATVASTGDRTAQVTAVRPGATSVIATYGGSGGPASVIVSATPKLQLVQGGFSAPTYLTQPPADTSRLFVVEQGGRIKVIRNDTLLATPFLDVSGLVAFGGERGLLSMAFHPNYANNHQFFVDYTDLSGTIQVVRYAVSTNPDVADPASAHVILSIPHPTYPNHNGGLVLFGPDGYLYIGVGDGGGTGDPSGNGQNTDTLLGKLLRIDVNAGSPYVVPASNPFVGLPPAKPEIWAYGLRNPWRFSFDRLTGDLYIADVGQDSMEEVDEQRALSSGGQNYGWNIMEGTLCYNPPTGCNQTGLTLPVYGYLHGVNDANGCAIIGGYVYRGRRLPVLGGRYVFGDLCVGWVKSFQLVNGVATNVVDYTPQLGVLCPSQPSTSYCITSFGQDTQGELYITTTTGNLYRIAPGP